MQSIRDYLSSRRIIDTDSKDVVYYQDKRPRSPIGRVSSPSRISRRSPPKRSPKEEEDYLARKQIYEASEEGKLMREAEQDLRDSGVRYSRNRYLRKLPWDRRLPEERLYQARERAGLRDIPDWYKENPYL